MSTQIRTYTAADRSICLTIFDSNMPLFFDASERLSLENWLTAKDQNRMAYSGNRAEPFYVMEQEGRVIACGGFYIPEMESRAIMVWGMVQGNSHRQGLGRQLLDYRIRQVRNNYPGCAVVLDTTQHSFRFFERQGFVVTDILSNAYGPGLDRYDMILE